ncbi:sporulation phosphorelay system protein KapB [Alkalihalophilus lindianensis]|uniref:Sporulation phosphorelay system protein KapB n=1 Tax=Alkalihalophilus lindianensis TaxID=1630542 RepID=A0ABU3X6M6_9BACI|nr:sporulation phosphorelay system protein KapB [Alkalihalophilus lindianensis]MDV2683545.1 sporulation phosphorelay system protein KapB [Alkalihalophilus lindianensis]
MHVEFIQAKYKTGLYIGELLEKRESEQKGLMKVLAVVKHPTQGDLHQPKQSDVAYFHQRKALAEFEKTWVPLATVTLYKGEVPSYKDSLKTAWQEKYDQLATKQTPFAQLSIQHLKELKTEYGI